MAENKVTSTLKLFETKRGIKRGTNLSSFQVAILVSNQAKSLSHIKAITILIFNHFFESDSHDIRRLQIYRA